MLKKYSKIFSLIFLTFFLFFFPIVLLAQYPPAGGSTLPPAGGTTGGMNIGGLRIDNPLRANSFTELFVGITNWIAGLAAIVAVLMVVIGGFQYMIAGGNEAKTKSAINTIKWALIGLVIILLSWSLLKTVLTLLGVTVT